MALQKFVATLNAGGLQKLKDQGAKVGGNQLAFYEDDETKAHLFYRRYMRNFFGVIFYVERDYSIYAPVVAPSGQRPGFQERTY